MSLLEQVQDALKSEGGPDIVKLSDEKFKEIKLALEQEPLEESHKILLLTSQSLDAMQFLQLYQLVATKDEFTPATFDLNPILKNIEDRVNRDDFSAEFPSRQIQALIDVYLENDMEVLKEKFIAALSDADEATALYAIKKDVPLNFEDEGKHSLIMAHSRRLQKCILEMYKRGAKPTPDQVTIMNKMSRVILDIPGVSPHTVDDLKGVFFENIHDPYPENELKHISRDLAQGLCYGFTAYWLYLKKYSEPDAYKKIIKKIISWDGEDNTLSKPLADTIRVVYDNVFYLAWEGSKKMMMGQDPLLKSDQHGYVHKRLNIIKPSEKPKIKKEFQFSFVMSHDELAQTLSTLIKPEKLIRLRIGPNHWAAIIQQGNEYHYFDPNATDYGVKLENIEDITKAVIKTYRDYYELEETYQDDYYGIRIDIYDDVKGEKVKYPSQESLMKSLLEKRGTHDEMAGCSIYKETVASFGDEESIRAFKDIKKAGFRRGY